MKNSANKKTINYDIAATTPTPCGESSIKFAEAEVFATDEDGVNFRTVGWIRGMFNNMMLLFHAD